MPEFASEEEKPLLVKLNGKLYDIRNFADKHPGGKKVLDKVSGGDIDKFMKGEERILGVKHEHSEAAYGILSQYAVDHRLKVRAQSSLICLEQRRFESGRAAPMESGRFERELLAVDSPTVRRHP